jgi:hypothetical protein
MGGILGKCKDKVERRKTRIKKRGGVEGEPLGEGEHHSEFSHGKSKGYTKTKTNTIYYKRKERKGGKKREQERRATQRQGKDAQKVAREK